MVTHPDGPLLVLGGAGTGKTHALQQRFAWLVKQGVPAHSVLALAFSPRAAESMLAAIEELVEPPYEELHVRTFGSFCERLLRDEAPEAGLAPGVRRGQPRRPRGADARQPRRAEPAPPRDPREPGAAAGGVRLADRPAEGGDGLPRGAGRPRGRRRPRARTPSAATRRGSSEFARIYADHDALLRRARRAGLRRPGAAGVPPAAREPARARARREALHATCWPTTSRTPRSPRRRCWGCCAPSTAQVTVAGDEHQATHRLRGAGRKNLDDFRRAFPGGEGGGAAREPALPGAACSPRQARWWGQRRGPTGREGGARALLALRLRARPGPGGGRGVRAPGRAAAWTPAPMAVLVRLAGRRGPGGRLGARGARASVPAVGIGGLLPARRGARRARLDAPAGRPRRLGRRGARAVAARRSGLHSVDIARLTQLARRRKLDMPVGGGERAGGTPAHPRGPRPRAGVPAPVPRGLRRVRGPPPGRVRAAADRAHRHPPPAGVRHPGRHRRAAAQRGQAARARDRLHAPRARRHAARLRPLPEGRRRLRAARGRGRAAVARRRPRRGARPWTPPRAASSTTSS